MAPIRAPAIMKNTSLLNEKSILNSEVIGGSFNFLLVILFHILLHPIDNKRINLNLHDNKQQKNMHRSNNRAHIDNLWTEGETLHWFFFLVPSSFPSF